MNYGKYYKEVVEAIQSHEYALPTIQRSFVWKPQDIECLFDSILRGYPFGIFLFWKMNDTLRREYRFYNFSGNYEEGKPQIPMDRPLNDSCRYGILDGQQRLTAMYIAIKGSYTYKYKNANAAKERKLYMNLLFNAEQAGMKYEFSFLANNELFYDTKHYWYLVNNILTDSNWKSSASATRIFNNVIRVSSDEECKQALENSSEDAIERLARLYTCICDLKLVNISEIDNSNENEVLDIFVRLNNQGKPLSRTDFIFSKIVAFWPDARKEIEQLQDDDYIKKFKIFDKDLIMRICLATTIHDITAKLTVSNFNENKVDTIKNNWENN